jgi:phosphate transport system substrate-binding protein
MILTIVGSNTMDSTAVPALVLNWMIKNKHARNVTIIQSGNERFDVVGQINGVEVVAKVEAPGSNEGFKCLASATCDIAASSRPATRSDSTGHLSGQDLTSEGNQWKTGRDGILLLVNQSNKVSNLTIRQIHDIYTCKVRYWDELGANQHEPIRAFARDDRSGTYQLFAEKVLQGDPLCKDVVRMPDSEQLASMVAADADAIGFAGMPFGLRVKQLWVNGIEPTPENVASQAYPLWRDLFYYTLRKPENPDVIDFIEFSRSIDGQAVVQKSGFVGLNYRPGIQEWFVGAHKVSTVNFAFNSSGLSQSNQQSIETLVAALNTEKRSFEVFIAGYTDDVGEDDYNLRLSDQRASSVVKLLPSSWERKTRGFGKQDLLATRSESRRVDIWVKYK